MTTGEIGDRIKELRKEKGMTQKELANAMGVTASMIGQYETGIRIPKYEPSNGLQRHYLFRLKP